MNRTILNQKTNSGSGHPGGASPAVEKLAGPFNQGRYRRYLSWRISAKHYAQSFGLKPKEAHQISLFIYQVLGEEDGRFLSAMEIWAREVALAKGSVAEILDAILILKVCRIDPNRVQSCRSVRAEVVRYVKTRYRR